MSSSDNSSDKKEKTTVYLVRHGTTAWNQQLRYQGRADNPLDEVGEKQGALLKKYFEDIHVDLGITSPLQRAVKTLEYALSSQKHPVPVIVEPDITEFDFGDADGLTKEEISVKYPVFYRKYILDEDRPHAAAPGGETLAQVYERMSRCILRIAREHPGETIVAASHGTAIQMFLNYASGIPAERIRRFLLYNVCVSCVEIDREGNTEVRYICDLHHVPEELRFAYNHQDHSQKT